MLIQRDVICRKAEWASNDNKFAGNIKHHISTRNSCNICIKLCANDCNSIYTEFTTQILMKTQNLPNVLMEFSESWYAKAVWRPPCAISMEQNIAVDIALCRRVVHGRVQHHKMPQTDCYIPSRNCFGNFSEGYFRVRHTNDDSWLPITARSIFVWSHERDVPKEITEGGEIFQRGLSADQNVVLENIKR